MPSDEDGRSWMDGQAGDLSPHRPWPHIPARSQAELETKFFEPDATINFNKAYPLQWWASPLSFGFISDVTRNGSVVMKTVSASRSIQRKLTQEEIDGLCEATSKRFRMMAYVSPLSGLGSIVSAYYGRARFRFPLWTPRPGGIVNPEVWPLKSMPLLRGQGARYAWHTMRALVYYPIWVIAVSVFVSSNVNTMLMADIAQDPRLQNIVQDMKNQLTQRQRSGAQGQSPGRQPGPPPPFSGRQPVPAAEQARMEEAYRKTSDPSTGEWQAQDVQNQDSFSYQEGSTQNQPSQPAGQQPRGFGSRSPPSGRPAWGRGAPQPSAQQGVPPSQPSTAEQSPYGTADPFDDDASPVAASARAADRRQSQNPQGGSSWERIRQETKADASTWKRGDRSSQDTAWSRMRQDTAPTDRDRAAPYNQEKYTYGESERSKSQKEFDAMLEAERKGVDQGGSGWSKSG